MYPLIIVEDDDNIRSGLVHLFPWKETGFHVTGDYSNGLAAWEHIKEHPDTCTVLCDVRMPVMDGLELARLVNENYPSVSVILISGYQDFNYAKQALLYHVRDFLVKPIRHSALMLSLYKTKDELDKKHLTTLTDVLPNQYYSQILRCVKNYMLENLRTATLEEAAYTVHLSSSYLSRLFKSQTGISFSEYLLKKRMEHACILLNNPTNKVYEISDTIGYDSPKNFSRAFKNYYQMTPKEFREKGGYLP